MDDVREKVRGVLYEYGIGNGDFIAGEILDLLPPGVGPRPLTPDERQRLADLRAAEFSPGSDQAFLLSVIGLASLPPEPSDRALEAFRQCVTREGSSLKKAIRAAYAAERANLQKMQTSGDSEGVRDE